MWLLTGGARRFAAFNVKQEIFTDLLKFGRQSPHFIFCGLAQNGDAQIFKERFSEIEATFID